MRKAAAVICLVFVLGLSLPGAPLPETAEARRGVHESFALTDHQEGPGFTLAANIRRSEPDTGVNVPALHEPPALTVQGESFFEALVRPDHRRPETVPASYMGPAVSLIALEIAGPLVRRAAPPRVSLSIFMGRGNGDPFSTLHETYAWRAAFKTMNLGAGLYRDIAIAKGFRIRPYLGVIRSHAIVRPSYPYALESVSYENRLTAVCIGLPLVCGF